MEKFEIYSSGKDKFYSNKKAAIDLHSQTFFGELKEGKVVYSLYEVLFLLKTGKVVIEDKKIDSKALIKRADHNIWLAFEDLRKKGYIVKEGLKFGTDFRVYKPGTKPGKHHSEYLLFVASVGDKLNLKDFAAKARIANTTHKKLLLALIDSEEDVNYYEANWKSIL